MRIKLCSSFPRCRHNSGIYALTLNYNAVSLELVTKKLCTLLRLLSGKRFQTIWRL